MSYRGDGRYDVPFMWGVTAVNYPMWVGGTAMGVLTGDLIGDPDRLGLDALFPAFFLGLLVGEATEGTARMGRGAPGRDACPQLSRR